MAKWKTFFFFVLSFSHEHAIRENPFYLFAWSPVGYSWRPVSFLLSPWLHQFLHGVHKAEGKHFYFQSWILVPVRNFATEELCRKKGKSRSPSLQRSPAAAIAPGSDSSQPWNLYSYVIWLEAIQLVSYKLIQCKFCYFAAHPSSSFFPFQKSSCADQ